MSYFYKCWNWKAHAVRTNVTWKYVLWWGFTFWISTGWNRDFYILQLMLFSGSRVFHFANSEWMWPTTTTLMRDCESDSPLSCTVNCTCTDTCIPICHCFTPTLGLLCTQVNSSPAHKAVEAQALYLKVSTDKTQAGSWVRAVVGLSVQKLRFFCKMFCRRFCGFPLGL